MNKHYYRYRDRLSNPYRQKCTIYTLESYGMILYSLLAPRKKAHYYKLKIEPISD